ncbi:MAG: dolichyl-phosphate beta-glucosyltransferase [Anaerolineae bacterium]
MEHEPYLSVVVPAYNEEKRLPGTLERICAYLGKQTYHSELIVVDDGSEDATARVARQMLEQMAPAQTVWRVIENDHRGKGYTVRTGILAAQGQYILFSDADLATPIEEVEKLLASLQAGYQVAIGSREGVGALRLEEPWYRHLMGRVFNLLVRIVAGTHYEDTQCGFKAFQRDAAHDLFNRLHIYGSQAKVIKGGAVTAFDVEVLFLAGKRGYRVTEVPVIWRYGENTKVNPLRDSVRMFRDVVRVRLNEWLGHYRD